MADEYEAAFDQAGDERTETVTFWRRFPPGLFELLHGRNMLRRMPVPDPHRVLTDVQMLVSA